MKKHSLLALGWFSLGLGTVGIFLPLLPTVPLWLLSAWCFSKSSERWNQWLLNHPRFGPVIKQWRNTSGIPIAIKLRAIAMIWLGIGISIAIVDKWYLRVMLALIATITSAYIFFKLPTLKNTNQLSNKNINQ